MTRKQRLAVHRYCSLKQAHSAMMDALACALFDANTRAEIALVQREVTLLMDKARKEVDSMTEA